MSGGTPKPKAGELVGGKCRACQHGEWVAAVLRIVTLSGKVSAAKVLHVAPRTLDRWITEEPALASLRTGRGGKRVGAGRKSGKDWKRNKTMNQKTVAPSD